MTNALNPDFAAVKEKRMSELTPAQFDDAKEAWLRDNLGWLAPQSEPHVTFLLRRLDEARALAKGDAPRAAAVRTLERMGYTHTGGELWRPPLGQPPAWVSEKRSGWQPIDTAPKDNARPLYLARFNDKGELVEIDFDGAWERWQESWELSHINGYAWTSAGGIEEPTHWSFQDEPLPATQTPAAEWDSSVYGYQDYFNAIAAATRVVGGAVAVSVADFHAAMRHATAVQQEGN